MASQISIQNSLSAGELSPSLYGRQDLDKYHSGTTTCRNFFANYRGGVSSRAGLAYVGTCKQQYPTPPRDIPFQFSLNQGYVLEFGDDYMRIKSNGAYVIESSKTIINITQAIQPVFTIPSHGYSVGDWIFIVDATGMTEFNELTWIVSAVLDTDNIRITDLFGNIIDSSTYPAYISGGTSARIYTVVAPYAAADLPYLKYVQSADTMTLTCVNTNTETEYPPYNLIRSGNTNWAFTQVSFGADISAPTNLKATALSSSQYSTWYSYVVTAINSASGEESIASSPVNIQNNDIALFAGTNKLTWSAVLAADSYNIYATTPSYGQEVVSGNLYGFVGTSLGTSFNDTNIIPDFSRVPPQDNNPFARGAVTDVDITANGTNYSQDTISYSVTTPTGSGFSGRPVVTDNSLSGFVIDQEGSGYETGDTISFSDSGGGVATGNYLFSDQPDTDSVIVINSVDYKFTNTDSPPVHWSPIESTLELTLQSLAQTLNAASSLSVNVASYTSDSTHLYITYKTSGVVGNDFTMSAGGAVNATPSGPTLTGGGTMGSGATATLVIGKESGTYPSVSSYFQQRRVYAGSLNNPDTYWMSQPGLFNNMDSSIPVTDSDAITGTPWAQQVNGIQFLVSMPGGLVVLTGKGAWQVGGGSSAAITPSDQTAVPQAYNGCNDIVPPIVNNYDILYIQSKGSIARDLSYNFFTNIYTGTDLTVLSNHLFTNYRILQWAWAEEPYKLIWCVRDDGILLCLTYLKEQDVYAWTRHDTNGLFVSVCSITEPPVDAVYVIVQRYVQGGWRYYSERMDNRVWNNVEDTFCVDSGLTYPVTYPDATLSPQALTGIGVAFLASSSVFTSDMVGDIIRVGNGKATVTSFVSGTQVLADITDPITNIIPYEFFPMATPAVSGTWSISTPTTVVSGLNHLEKQFVSILADGSVNPPQVVLNGQITLQNPASLVVVGLAYSCQVQTMYLDHPDGSNTDQNRRKNISAVGLRVETSRGLQLGADQIDASTQPNYVNVPWVNMNEIKERTMFVNAGSAIPLYTGDYYKAITSGWDVRGQVAVQQTYPLPANILAVVSYWLDGDEK